MAKVLSLRKISLRKVSLLSITFLFILFTLVLPATSKAISNGADQAEPTAELNYVPGQVLVKFKSGVPRQRKRSSKTKAGVSGIVNRVKMSGPDIYLYKLRPDRDISQTVKELNSDKNVLVAEPNFIYKTALIPNDTYFNNNQWHLRNTGQTIKLIAGKRALISAPPLPGM